jgi:hypothetical protein
MAFKKGRVGGSVFLVMSTKKMKVCLLALTCGSYPSGRVAISIIAFGERQYQYIVQDDRDDPAVSNIVAVFSTDGHGLSFFNSGQSR